MWQKISTVVIRDAATSAAQPGRWKDPGAQRNQQQIIEPLPQFLAQFAATDRERAEPRRRARELVGQLGARQRFGEEAFGGLDVGRCDFERSRLVLERVLLAGELAGQNPVGRGDGQQHRADRRHLDQGTRQALPFITPQLRQQQHSGRQADNQSFRSDPIRHAAGDAGRREPAHAATRQPFAGQPDAGQVEHHVGRIAEHVGGVLPQQGPDRRHQRRDVCYSAIKDPSGQQPDHHHGNQARQPRSQPPAENPGLKIAHAGQPASQRIAGQHHGRVTRMLVLDVHGADPVCLQFGGDANEAHAIFGDHRRARNHDRLQYDRQNEGR